jgi:predicted transposase YdaD
MREAEVDLLPLVGVMKGSREAVWEAEKRIYASELPTEEKADLLTILAIFAGLKDRELTMKLVQRRRDIMIESYAYEIIKQEGFEQGLQQGREEGREQGLQQGRRQGELDRARKAIYEVLEARFELIDRDLVEKIEEITLIPVLENLLKMSVKVNDLETFREILTRVSSHKAHTP